MFRLAEWESKVSSLPYYIWEDDGKIPPLTRDLEVGTYLIRFNRETADTVYHSTTPSTLSQEIVARGYTKLPSMITLEHKWYGTDSGLILGVMHDIEEMTVHLPYKQYARGLHNDIKFSDNRLYWTLPYPEAEELMYRWIENCAALERTARFGISLGSNWDDKFRSTGFIGVRKVDDKTEAIDLIGVNTHYRGEGIGRSLVFWSLNTSKAERMIVKTESTNIAALNMYKSCEFVEVSREYQYWARVE